MIVTQIVKILPCEIEPEVSLPCWQEDNIVTCGESVRPGTRLYDCLIYSEVLLVSAQTLFCMSTCQLPATGHCMYSESPSIFRDSLLCWQPEDAPCRRDKELINIFRTEKRTRERERGITFVNMKKCRNNLWFIFHTSEVVKINVLCNSCINLLHISLMCTTLNNSYVIVYLTARGSPSETSFKQSRYCVCLSAYILRPSGTYLKDGHNAVFFRCDSGFFLPNEWK
jgi:hypothetical protein